jgi:hypothetical protein
MDNLIMKHWWRAITLVMTLIGACTLSAKASAQDLSSRAYLGGALGSNAFYAFLPDRNVGAMRGWSVGVHGGYYFLPHVAAEGGLFYSSALNASVEANVAGIDLSASARGALYLPYAALQFAVPLVERLALGFKLGVMYPVGRADLSASASGLSTAGRIAAQHIMPFSGLAMHYHINSEWDCVLSYQGAVYFLASGGVLTTGLTHYW